MVNIEGCGSKAAVLAALYNAARPQGMGFLQYDPKPMSLGEAAAILDKTKSFDYLKGRVLKIDLTSDKEFDERLFDRDNGRGAAELVIAHLRETGQTEKGLIETMHDAGKASAASEALRMATGIVGDTFTLGAEDVGPQLTDAVNKAVKD